MRQQQILSTAVQASGASANLEVFVFDACQVGVVLRAVLYVEAVVAVGVMYFADDPLSWLERIAFVTGGALPATLAWLVLACFLKRPLGRSRPSLQVAAGLLLGVLAGFFACWILYPFAAWPSPPWIAAGSSGAMLAAGLVTGLLWRARGRVPAATSARLMELQSRIQPHFLFNALNTAIALVQEEPALAEQVLEDLSDLFRHALTEPDEHTTLAAELELARRYLQIEQLRFGERLRVTWKIDPTAGAARLPPLVLQPLVENAVRHGVEPSTDGAEVRIATRVRSSRITVEISNTVPAGEGRRGHGMALANVRDRLRLLHDLEGGFHTRLKDNIYTVSIELPLATARSGGAA